MLELDVWETLNNLYPIFIKYYFMPKETGNDLRKKNYLMVWSHKMWHWLVDKSTRNIHHCQYFSMLMFVICSTIIWITLHQKISMLYSWKTISCQMTGYDLCNKTPLVMPRIKTSKHGTIIQFSRLKNQEFVIWNFEFEISLKIGYKLHFCPSSTMMQR